MGGGFGGKGGLWNHTPLCAAAAKVVKRPVKLSLSREGVYRVVGGRTIAEQRVALGASKDGTSDRADPHRHHGDHHRTDATPSNARSPRAIFTRRRICFIEQKIVNLDTLANTWMRAPGESIGTFALESAMDELAYALQMDPIELRRINEPEKDPTKDTPFSSRHLTEAYRRGAERFGWNARNPEPRSQRDGNWLVGQGVATAYYPYYRFPSWCGCVLTRTGRAVVQTPAAEMGMGTATVQTAARRRSSGSAADTVSLSLRRLQAAGYAGYGGRLESDRDHLRGRAGGGRADFIGNC